jgi:hypothetical protein
MPNLEDKIRSLLNFSSQERISDFSKTFDEIMREKVSQIIEKEKQNVASKYFANIET